MELGQFIGEWMTNVEVQALLFFSSVAIGFDFLKRRRLSLKKVLVSVLGAWGAVNIVCLIIVLFLNKGN